MRGRTADLDAADPLRPHLEQEFRDGDVDAPEFDFDRIDLDNAQFERALADVRPHQLRARLLDIPHVQLPPLPMSET